MNYFNFKEAIGYTVPTIGYTYLERLLVWKYASLVIEKFKIEVVLTCQPFYQIFII